MASWLFGSSNAANKPTYFDIRLEDSTLRLPRDDEYASYGNLNGVVVLCLNKPLSTKYFKLHLKGKHYANWGPNELGNRQTRMAWPEVTFYHQDWNFSGASGRSKILQPGNYEFSFSISLPNTMPESVDGLSDCYIRYELTAAINCSSGTTRASRTMRVAKTRDFLSFLEPKSIETPWPDKITYKVCIPGRAFVLGDPIEVDFRYIALRKGVYPTSIQLQLVESHTLYSKSTGLRTIRQTRDTIRADDSSTYDASSGEKFTTEDMEEWCVLSHVLPSSMTELCLASCRTSIIDVEHKLKIIVRVANPEGHISQIAVSFHVDLCSMPETKPPGLSSNSLCTSKMQPPPSYADYISDPPYDVANFHETTGVVESPSSEYAPTNDGAHVSYPACLLDTPCYDTAICSVIPQWDESPAYWHATSEWT